MFHDFRRLRAQQDKPDSAPVSLSNSEKAAPPPVSPRGGANAALSLPPGYHASAKQKAAYAHSASFRLLVRSLCAADSVTLCVCPVTKAPPVLLSPKRVLTDVNFGDLREVLEAVQSEASKQNMKANYASVLRLLLLVPDDTSTAYVSCTI